jgi:hypothetical protein
VHQLDDWKRAILLPPLLGHGGDSALHRVIDTRIRHQELLILFDPSHIIRDQDYDGLPPEDPIHIEAEGVQPHLTLLAHLAGLLAEAEDAPEAGRFDDTAPGMAQDDLWRQIIHPALGISTFMRPMAPELIVRYERRMLPLDSLPIGAVGHIGIEPPALDGEAPFCVLRPQDRGYLRNLPGPFG